MSPHPSPSVTHVEQLYRMYGGDVRLVDWDDSHMAWSTVRESSIVFACIMSIRDSIAMTEMDAEFRANYPDLAKFVVDEYMRPMMPLMLRAFMALGFFVFSRVRVPIDGTTSSSWMRKHGEKIQEEADRFNLIYPEEEPQEPDFTTTVTVPVKVDPSFYQVYICRDGVGDTHLHAIAKPAMFRNTQDPPQLFVVEIEEYMPDFETGELNSPLKHAFVPFRNLALMNAISVQAAYARAYQVLVVQHDKDQNQGQPTESGVRQLLGDSDLDDMMKHEMMRAMMERQEQTSQERSRVAGEMNDLISGTARHFERPAHLGDVKLQSGAEQVMYLGPGTTTAGQQPTMAQMPGNVGEMQVMFDTLVCESLGVPKSLATSGDRVARNIHVAADTDTQKFVRTVHASTRMLEHGLRQIFALTQGGRLEHVHIPVHSFVDLDVVENLWRLGAVEFHELTGQANRALSLNIRDVKKRKPRPGALDPEKAATTKKKKTSSR